MSRGPRSALLAALAVAAAVAAFVVLRPDDAPAPAVTPTPPAAMATGATPAREEPAPAPSPPLVRVTDGQPVGGVTELSARRGETVRFAVLSDSPEEVHVHGYERLRALAPGERAELAFPADLEGVFEVELHGSGLLIAELTVYP